MYQVIQGSRFKKSYKKVIKHKDFKKEEFEFVLENLVSGIKLSEKHKDHQLNGEYLGFRECHIQNDILLIYKIHEDILVLVLTDIGSHSELFK